MTDYHNSENLFSHFEVMFYFRIRSKNGKPLYGCIKSYPGRSGFNAGEYKTELSIPYFLNPFGTRSMEYQGEADIFAVFKNDTLKPAEKIELIESLIKCGIDVNTVSEDKKTILDKVDTDQFPLRVQMIDMLSKYGAKKYDGIKKDK